MTSLPGSVPRPWRQRPLADREQTKWLRTLGLFAVTAALIAVAWLSLQDETASWWRLIAVLALALAPTLATLLTRRWWIGLIVLAVGAIPALGIAMGVSLADMRPGDADFYGPVWGAFVDGLQDFYEVRLPFDPADHAEAYGVVLLSIYGFTAVVGLLLAAGAPLLASIVLLVGVGWPVTPAAVAGGISALRMGALLLAAILLVLFLTRTDRRPLRGVVQAAVLGAVLVFAAVGATTSSAVAKDAFLSWTAWDPYDAPTEPIGVRYVWNSNYRGIRFPEDETVVLRIKAPERSLYWRATTLDEFTGVGWREQLQVGPPQATREFDAGLADAFLPEAARDEKNWVRQDVTVEALADTHLIAAADPVRWRPGANTPVQYAQGGVVLAPEGLVLGETYTVWSYAPQVKPKDLATLPADYPAEIDRYLEVVPDVRFPAFGVSGRNRAVDALFGERDEDLLLAEYEPLYREARRIVGTAASPYLAAVSLEAWLRSGGGFVYEELPEQPLDATPPLVDFVLRTREGYCQQYAGAMAIMLRLLGVPARVAAGFTSGEYDERRGEWVVSDHNAHTWVEVYFPGYGWLPFDPTPGRGELSADYSTSSAAFPQGGARDTFGVDPEALSAILRQRLEGLSGALGGSGGLVGPSLSLDDEGGLGIPALVFLVLGGALAVLLGGKALRRALRFRSHDPRQLASACRRDLLAFLADQGVSVSDSVTLEELGEFVEREYRVNAMPFVRAARAARFGPPTAAPEHVRVARRELRTLLRQLRSQLGTASRVRGALNLRSLTV
jgi:transglutaminase-like putative cysteine protease